MQKDEADDAREHYRRAEHRIEEEFDSGIAGVLVAPLADEEIHRHQHDLKEHEEQQQVQRQERPQAACFQHEQPDIVRLRVAAGV